ncbi:bacterio-opsin activator [Haloprofundus marisrubri]|uniref:Bacterio-opsin activator n=1 Tax=Haloprofundus marisrubri TaxID=1514971 RepID=A0A0W1RE68_9EURY|nr:helix-turn-helix domain-containing protein [Haloprofundus marisrubri]KTG11363.1 bacterio-opsin activator [Haloprofundus marisrubri]
MRYLTARLVPKDQGVFHPLGNELSEEPSIRREAIHHAEHLDDGTVVLLAEASGNRSRYEEIMTASSYVDDFLIAGEKQWVSVSRFAPTNAIHRALERQRDAGVVVDMPIRFTTDGSMEITYLGSDVAFRQLFEATTEMEDVPLRFEVVETGDYEPGETSLVSSLTTRQRKVVETAVETGYYRSPREASLEEVADAVGITPSTVSEHLRKIESHVFSTLFG